MDESAERKRRELQPWIGLAGLVFVVPIALVLTIGAGRAEDSLRLLDPITTFALPLTVMVSFWWEDWPGSRFRRAAAGWADLALIAVGAIVLTFIGQLILAGRLDWHGVLSVHATPGQSPAFPATLPLAGAAFVAMLQITFVNERWPVQRLGRTLGGLGALALSWAVSLILLFTLVELPAEGGGQLRTLSGPIPAGHFAGAVLCVGAWQAVLYVAAQGGPFAAIRRRAWRLVIGNVAVLGPGIATYLLATRAAGVDAGVIAAVAASVITAAIVWAILAERWPFAERERYRTLIAFAVTLVGGAVVYAGLRAIAGRLDWSAATPDDWVAFAGSNAIAGAVILHVAVGRRWPLRIRDDTGDET